MHFIISCNGKSVESKFFYEETNRVSRISKLESLPLVEQYKIFKYGNQKIHPAQKSLAGPIAKQGKSALDYVLQQIRNSENDLDFRDSMIIFREIEKKGYYQVCKDQRAIQEIRENENKIQHKDWRAIYHEMLEDLC